jgi:hypothetical protein
MASGIALQTVLLAMLLKPAGRRECSLSRPPQIPAFADRRFA